MRTIKLVDLNAEIRNLKSVSGESLGTALYMTCPVCDDHQVIIPFGPQPDSIEGVMVWKHVSGSTIEDLTLSPSYRVLRNGRGCRLHGFVRNGRWENCSDSQKSQTAE